MVLNESLRHDLFASLSLLLACLAQACTGGTESTDLLAGDARAHAVPSEEKQGARCTERACTSHSLLIVDTNGWAPGPYRLTLRSDAGEHACTLDIQTDFEAIVASVRCAPILRIQRPSDPSCLRAEGEQKPRCLPDATQRVIALALDGVAIPSMDARLELDGALILEGQLDATVIDVSGGSCGSCTRNEFTLPPAAQGATPATR